MKEELPDNHGVAYLMIIDKREKIEKAYKDLKNLGYVEKYKILKNLCRWAIKISKMA